MGPQDLKDKLKAAREELIDAKGKLEIEAAARAAAEAREAAHEAERREAAVRVKEERDAADVARKALEVRCARIRGRVGLRSLCAPCPTLISGLV